MGGTAIVPLTAGRRPWAALLPGALILALILSLGMPFGAAAEGRRHHRAAHASASDSSTLDPAERREIRKTLDRIAAHGPFLHRQDDTVFGNREGRLPAKPRGYWHEYTVETPGSPDRGARRLIRGSGGELYYTHDHYRTFVPIDPEALR